MKNKTLICLIVPLALYSLSIKAQLKVTTGGSIGVGTTSPASKLDVEGGVSIGATYSGTTAAPSNGAIIQGNVGIGVTSPIQKLDVNGSLCVGGVIQNGTTAVTGTTDLGLYSQLSQYLRIVTNAQPVRFYTDGGVGGIGGTEKVSIEPAGNLLGTNGTASAPGFSFVGDTDNGMYKSATNELSFSTAGTQRMSIASNGQVGIGAGPSGAYKLTINGSGLALGGVWTASDKRYKKNIQPIDNALQKILKLNGATYEYQTEQFKELNFTPGKSIGFIAQELKEILPEAVQIDEKGFYAVNYDEIIPVLVEAIKEQNKTIETLKDKVQEMNTAMQDVKTDVGECCKSRQNQIDQSLNSSTKGTSLDQNIPNPFTEKTQINYTIGMDAKNVTISVFDMQGTLLKTYDHLNLSNGKGSVTINGGEYKAGIYLYSLIIDGKEFDTKRMILTK